MDHGHSNGPKPNEQLPACASIKRAIDDQGILFIQEIGNVDHSNFRTAAVSRRALQWPNRRPKHLEQGGCR